MKFLKHIERTKTIFHLISAESDDPVRDYRVVRKELEAYGPALADKEEHVYLTKSDTVAPEILKGQLAALAKAGVTAEAVSVLDTESLAGLQKTLNDIRDGI